MTVSEDNAVQMKIAHLQMLQDVITRMANYSAAIKNYAVTVGAALLALDGSDFGDSDCLEYAVIPFLAFMFLDVRYLSLEKAFREAYDSARLLPPQQTDFCIKPTSSGYTRQALKSWSIWAFYIPLILIFIIM